MTNRGVRQGSCVLGETLSSTGVPDVLWRPPGRGSVETSSKWSCAPSFWASLRLWLATTFEEMPRSVATSLMDLRRARETTTFRSRGVSRFERVLMLTILIACAACEGLDRDFSIACGVGASSNCRFRPRTQSRSLAEPLGLSRRSIGPSPVSASQTDHPLEDRPRSFTPCVPARTILADQYSRPPESPITFNTTSRNPNGYQLNRFAIECSAENLANLLRKMRPKNAAEAL